MKRNSLIILLLATVIFSCKKDQTPTKKPDQSSTLYKIDLGVGFTQTIDTLNGGLIKMAAIIKKTAALSDTLKSSVNVINYQVYDSNMHIVRFINQQNNDPAFGTISNELPTGTYTVIISAGSANFEVNEYTDPSTAPFAKLGYPVNLQNLPPGTSPNYLAYGPFQANTFYKKFTLTVGTSGASYAVNLDRIVGQLKIVIKDRIPTDVKQIAIEVYGDVMDKDIFTLAPDTSQTPFYYSNPSSFSAGAANTTFYIPIGNTSTPFRVEIQAANFPVPTVTYPWDAPRVVYADKTITGVTCANNQTTVLTGNLFSGGNTNSGFTVSYNPTWDTGSPTTIHF